MVCVVLGAGEIMAAKIIFVNQNDKAQSFKVNLFGPEKNRVKVANVLAVFKSSVAIMGDGSIMEADDDGLSMDTFVAGGTYNLSLVPQEVQPLSGTPEESPVMMPSLPNWGTNTGDVRSVENLNTNTPKEKTFPKGLKRDFRGIPIMGSDQGGLETVEPSSSHVENIQESQQIVEHQPHEVGDLVGFLQGSSGQGLQLSKDDGGSAGEGESDDDAAGSTPCIDNGKASRGHTRCVKCGHSKNPSAKLQCTHCGAYLRDQTKARVAQRWAMLKEKAKREGRLGDKAWQRRKKYAFDKLTDLTLLDLENTYFALFMSRRNREGDKFSYDGWYSEGAGKEFVTTGDVEAIWKSFVKKHHKRKLVPTIEYDVVGGELQAGPG
ncbi:hypothetical protein M758_10G108400 [Ceratodon purpureus]|uniref:Uncharacterized protein n=1 Tax=Ceratodon purpureus TaxID=3225 RepID=A0A8T0GLT1_CERPU|nr:hypothetical protein KC19_10G112000 [Ceratodon purpureus]KAG0603624.1 hypothetical protein M758_10G108400 [Ceratodon purpureus]